MVKRAPREISQRGNYASCIEKALAIFLRHGLKRLPVFPVLSEVEGGSPGHINHLAITVEEIQLSAEFRIEVVEVFQMFEIAAQTTVLGGEVVGAGDGFADAVRGTDVRQNIDAALFAIRIQSVTSST